MSAEREAFIPNPVFGGLLGVCILAAAADTFAAGFYLGLGAALSGLLLSLILPALGGIVPDRLRAPLSLGLSSALALIFGFTVGIYAPAEASGLGIYLPLLAVNCLSLHAIRRASTPSSGRCPDELRSAARTVILEAAGFFAAAAAIGLVREAAGLGSITFPLPGNAAVRIELAAMAPVRLLAAPAGGFIAIGCLAALYRLALRARGRRIL